MRTRRYRTNRIKDHGDHYTKRDDGETTCIGTRSQDLVPRSNHQVPQFNFLVTKLNLIRIHHQKCFIFFFLLADEKLSIVCDDFKSRCYRGLIPTGEIFYDDQVKKSPMISSYGKEKVRSFFVLKRDTQIILYIYSISCDRKTRRKQQEHEEWFRIFGR